MTLMTRDMRVPALGQELEPHPDRNRLVAHVAEARTDPV